MQVESGMILFIDPCVLFDRNEREKWLEMCHADDTPKAIEAALRKKYGVQVGCIHTEDGDGVYEIHRSDDGVQVKGA